jgi:hypothetical protein
MSDFESTSPSTGGNSMIMMVVFSSCSLVLCIFGVLAIIFLMPEAFESLFKGGGDVYNIEAPPAPPPGAPSGTPAPSASPAPPAQPGEWKCIQSSSDQCAWVKVKNQGGRIVCAGSAGTCNWYPVDQKAQCDSGGTSDGLTCDANPTTGWCLEGKNVLVDGKANTCNGSTMAPTMAPVSGGGTLINMNAVGLMKGLKMEPSGGDKFELLPSLTAPGWVRIKNMNNGKCLRLKDASSVEYMDCAEHLSYLWAFDGETQQKDNMRFGKGYNATNNRQYLLGVDNNSNVIITEDGRQNTFWHLKLN